MTKYVALSPEGVVKVEPLYRLGSQDAILAEVEEGEGFVRVRNPQINPNTGARYWPDNLFSGPRRKLCEFCLEVGGLQKNK